MSNWIKTHKPIFAGICLLVYAFGTAIPVAFSYGWLTGIRPAILITDVLSFAIGLTLLLFDGTLS